MVARSQRPGASGLFWKVFAFERHVSDYENKEHVRRSFQLFLTALFEESRETNGVYSFESRSRTAIRIEKQAAEIEGGEFEEIGEKWISDGTGGNVNDVKWAGMAESLRLHAEDKAVFIDCRERFEFPG